MGVCQTSKRSGVHHCKQTGARVLAERPNRIRVSDAFASRTKRPSCWPAPPPAALLACLRLETQLPPKLLAAGNMLISTSPSRIESPRIYIRIRTTTDFPVFLLCAQILSVAAAVERGCRHPLAEAVVLAVQKQLIPGRWSPIEAEGLRTVPGMGASAQVPKFHGFLYVHSSQVCFLL